MLSVKVKGGKSPALMVRFFLSVLFSIAVLLAVSPAALQAQENQLDASLALFTTLAALDATGNGLAFDSPGNHPLRAEVYKAIQAKNVPVLDELKEFIARHRTGDELAEFSRYVSFALCVTDPPELKYRYAPEELPPGVYELQGFEELLRRFYEEAGIDELWTQAQPVIEEELRRYQEPLAQEVLKADAYLQIPSGLYLGRTYRVFVELLGPPKQIHFRNFKNDYFVVVTRWPEPPIEEILETYLQYLVDPIVIKYAAELNEKRALIDFALGAPLLPEQYKKDFVLLAGKCLVKAVRARLAPKSERERLVDEAVRRGYILTPYFYEALQQYEKQQQSLRFYFGQIVQGIDLARETQRLDRVEFLERETEQPGELVERQKRERLKRAYELVNEAERAYHARQFEKARDYYRQALALEPDKVARARCFYGLGRIALAEGDIESAEGLLKKALSEEPDPVTASWAHVYLGRIADVRGDRKAAVEHYQQVLTMEGAAPEAKVAAQKGLAQPFGQANQ